MNNQQKFYKCNKCGSTIIKIDNIHLTYMNDNIHNIILNENIISNDIKFI